MESISGAVWRLRSCLDSQPRLHLSPFSLDLPGIKTHRAAAIFPTGPWRQQHHRLRVLSQNLSTVFRKGIFQSGTCTFYFWKNPAVFATGEIFPCHVTCWGAFFPTHWQGSCKFSNPTIFFWGPAQFFIPFYYVLHKDQEDEIYHDYESIQITCARIVEDHLIVCGA